jgi:uncharacterized membrane protein YqjE
MSVLPPGAARGLFDSLGNLAGTLVDVAQTRLSLLSIDLEEGHQQLLSLIITVVVALMGLAVGAVLTTIALVYAFWDTHRLLVLGILATVYLTAGAASLILALRRARARPRLFAASLAELAKDRLLLARR